MRLSIWIYAVLITLFVASQVAAQDSQSQPKAEIKMSIGASDFCAENGACPHLVVGTAFRVHISRHWSIEPEFNYMRRSSNDEDYVVQPNLVYEFNSRESRFVPYLVGGVGFIRHKSVYNGSDFVTRAPVTYDTSYKTWSASAGAGLKVFLTKRVFIAPEARIGYQPYTRASVGIGYVFPVSN